MVGLPACFKACATHSPLPFRFHLLVVFTLSSFFTLSVVQPRRRFSSGILQIPLQSLVQTFFLVSRFCCSFEPSYIRRRLHISFSYLLSHLADGP